MWIRAGQWKALFTLAMVICASRPIRSQNPQIKIDNNPPVPTVTFSWALFFANPSSYSIAIASTGTATYKSTPNQVSQTGVPYTVEFLASAPFRSQVLQLTRRLHYLDLPSTQSLLSAAREQVVTLTFRAGKMQHQIVFHHTKNVLLHKLVEMFENLSATLEFGRRLEKLHEQHSTALNGELQRMLTLARDRRLPELQAVAHVLRAIASDKTLEKPVQLRAEAILALVSS